MATRAGFEAFNTRYPMTIQNYFTDGDKITVDLGIDILGKIFGKTQETRQQEVLEQFKKNPQGFVFAHHKNGEYVGYIHWTVETREKSNFLGLVGNSETTACLGRLSLYHEEIDSTLKSELFQYTLTKAQIAGARIFTLNVPLHEKDHYWRPAAIQLGFQVGTKIARSVPNKEEREEVTIYLQR